MHLDDHLGIESVKGSICAISKRPDCVCILPGFWYEAGDFLQAIQMHEIIESKIAPGAGKNCHHSCPVKLLSKQCPLQFADLNTNKAEKRGLIFQDEMAATYLTTT